MTPFIDIQPELCSIADEAAKRQSQALFRQRTCKTDGSVLTEIDLYIQDRLVEVLKSWMPSIDIIAEEGHETKVSDGAALAAVIDPIDGTDSFSQGIPTWAISVGIVDPSRGPVAGFIAAPALGLWVLAQERSQVWVNGEKHKKQLGSMEVSRLANLCVSSRVHQQLELNDFPGKLRSYGSAALHLLWPSLYDGVIGGLQDDRAFVWDVAGAAAIAAATGLTCRYLSGQDIDWGILLDKKQIEDFILIASPNNTERIRSLIRRR
ncbi:MAG: inositol monophosphatase family protein [Planctomycetota bacterium]